MSQIRCTASISNDIHKTGMQKCHHSCRPRRYLTWRYAIAGGLSFALLMQHAFTIETQCIWRHFNRPGAILHLYVLSPLTNELTSSAWQYRPNCLLTSSLIGAPHSASCQFNCLVPSTLYIIAAHGDNTPITIVSLHQIFRPAFFMQLYQCRNASDCRISAINMTHH